jgi:hypothetical protein
MFAQLSWLLHYPCLKMRNKNFEEDNVYVYHIISYYQSLCISIEDTYICGLSKTQINIIQINTNNIIQIYIQIYKYIIQIILYK